MRDKSFPEKAPHKKSFSFLSFSGNDVLRKKEKLFGSAKDSLVKKKLVYHKFDDTLREGRQRHSELDLAENWMAPLMKDAIPV